MAGAEDYVTNGRDGLLLTPREDKPGTPGTIDVVGFADGEPPRLISVEAKGGSSDLGSRMVEDGLKAEQGSPEYLKWVLERDPDLRAVLQENPAVRERIEQAINDGTLRYEYHKIHVGTDGSVTHSEFDLQRGDEPFRSKVSGKPEGGMRDDASGQTKPTNPEGSAVGDPQEKGKGRNTREVRGAGGPGPREAER